MIAAGFLEKAASTEGLLAALLMTLLGVGLPLVVAWDKRRKREREGRIDSVVKKYRESVRGLRGLLDAGIATLGHEAEVRTAVQRITAEVGEDPLAGHSGALEGRELHGFFQLFRANVKDCFLPESEELEDALNRCDG